MRQAVAPLMLKTGEVLPHVEGMDAVAQDFVDKMRRDLHPMTKMIDNFEGKMFLWSMESISLMLINKRFGTKKRLYDTTCVTLLRMSRDLCVENA